MWFALPTTSARLSVLPLLSVAAEVSSLRVSPMVLANDYRHPVAVARDAATLDILSEGRFELGIGTGWIEQQYDSAGLTYNDPKTRVARFKEAIAVIKGCWGGEPFTFSGDHYHLDSVTSPTPYQRPHPPLLIAGSGRSMLTFAGTAVDIIGISPLRPVASSFDHFGPSLATSGQRIGQQLEWIKEGAGARFDEIELSVMAHHLEITDDPEGRATDLAAAWGSTVADVLGSPHVFLGSVGRSIETLEERRENFGISYVVFLGADLELVEPIVSHLARA
ncbi:MAG: TIGR03621 family F420-dependent LLM class oxidoreductase [Acidimicrobiia bacterium]